LPERRVAAHGFFRAQKTRFDDFPVIDSDVRSLVQPEFEDVCIMDVAFVDQVIRICGNRQFFRQLTDGGLPRYFASVHATAWNGVAGPVRMTHRQYLIVMADKNADTLMAWFVEAPNHLHGLVAVLEDTARGTIKQARAQRPIIIRLPRGGILCSIQSNAMASSHSY
jgi:hypothetical protein